MTRLILALAAVLAVILWRRREPVAADGVLTLPADHQHRWRHSFDIDWCAQCAEMRACSCADDGIQPADPRPWQVMEAD